MMEMTDNVSSKRMTKNHQQDYGDTMHGNKSTKQPRLMWLCFPNSSAGPKLVNQSQAASTNAVMVSWKTTIKQRDIRDIRPGMSNMTSKECWTWLYGMANQGYHSSIGHKEHLVLHPGRQQNQSRSRVATMAESWLNGMTHVAISQSFSWYTQESPTKCQAV